MDPIQKALMDVKYKIPPQILETVFIRSEFGYRPLPITVDSQICEKVIYPRVLTDCSLLGGTQVVIPMVGINPDYLDLTTIVYRIPKDRTQGRTITRVLSMEIGFGSMYGSAIVQAQSGYSAVADAASTIVNSHAPIPLVSTAHLRLIAENTVLVTERASLPDNVGLRCYLDYDERLSQLRPTAYIHFSQMVELAVKAYIYNTSTISIGQAQLSGGMELGRFREIVDSYADANELYTTFIEEKWRRILLMNDPTSRERHLRSMLAKR